MRGWDLIVKARGSIDKTNRRGESGHPWRVPLDKLKGFEVKELV